MRAEVIGPDDVAAFLAAVRTAFHNDPGEAEDEALGLQLVEPERSLAVRDQGRIVATASIYSRELTVPGGPVPAAAVSQVGVRPTHRRRGLLTALMRRQLEDLRAGGEAVAALWASEGAIYGRFGYGLAAWTGTLDVPTVKTRLRDDVPRAEAPAELTTPGDALPALQAVYEAVRATRPGLLDRRGAWWDHRLHDPKSGRDGASALRAAVQPGPDAQPAGYALYAAKLGWGDAGPDGTATVREIVATTPEAENALWGYLLELDLIRTVSYELAPADDPPPHLLTEPGAARPKRFQTLWVRLADVRRALAQRAYAVPFELVLDVADPVLPENAGRYRLAWDGERASCEPTTAVPDLATSATALGAAYLGGTALLPHVATGQVRERRPGAVAVASRAFRGDREPWAAETF